MGACCSSSQPSEPSSLMHFHQQAAQQHSFPKPWGLQARSPFLNTLAPNGMIWRDYVETGSTYIDGQTFLLVGPWAECICWGVHFEHTNAWQNMPEYSTEAPVGGILADFQTSAIVRVSSPELLAAAERLEEAAHAAAERGLPLPVIHCRVGESQAWQAASMGPAGQHPMYCQAACGPAVPAAPYSYGQPGGAFQSQAGFSHPMGYSDPPHMYGAGPTLLQQHTQNQSGGGMGDGAKMALAAAGGVVAGAGGYYLASHMDDVVGAVGDTFGDAGEFVGGAFEDAGEFLEDVF